MTCDRHPEVPYEVDHRGERYCPRCYARAEVKDGLLLVGLPVVVVVLVIAMLVVRG